MTAPKPSGRTGCNSNSRTLANLSVPSEPGNERRAMEQVAEVVRDLDLPPGRLERLNTAVAEATMNAMEHGNKYQPEVPVEIQVCLLEESLVVRITDRGSGPPPNLNAEAPDLEAKLEGLQTSRGWGLFLIRNMVDEMHVTGSSDHHTVELFLYLKGGDGAN